MTANEAYEVFKILKGSFRTLFGKTREEEKELMGLWYTHLKPYDFQDAKNAAIDYVMSETAYPRVADIVNAIHRTAENRKKREEYSYQRTKTVRCIHCKDTGLIVTTSPTGVMLGRPCTMCDRGQKIPTPDQTRENAIKAGHPITEAPEEFYNSYVFGR